MKNLQSVSVKDYTLYLLKVKDSVSEYSYNVAKECLDSGAPLSKLERDLYFAFEDEMISESDLYTLHKPLHEWRNKVKDIISKSNAEFYGLTYLGDY